MLALDRWIALILLGVFLVYGYTAWFTMDDSLAPFMRRNPIWPSTFPKLLSVLGVLTTVVILLGLEKSEPKEADIDYRKLGEYHVLPAVLLLVLMVCLGERKWHVMIPVAIIATLSVWYLVQEVLGIYLRPFPSVMGV